MNILNNKRALCFLALPHHNKLLVPVMQQLQAGGMQVQYCTTAAEAAFELTLLEAKLPYIHAQDYMGAIQDKINNALDILIPQWQHLFLTNAILRGVALPIQDKVLISAIENVFCFDEMIKQVKPDIIFALHELNPWGKTLGYLSHKYKVPYVTFQEGLFYTSIPFNRFHTDYSTACVVWGEQTRQLLVAAGCSNDKIVMLGNVDLELAKEKALSVQNVRHTREMLKLIDGQRLVTIFPSHATYKPFKVPAFIKWLKGHSDIVICFKWHPTATVDNINEAMGPLLKCSNIRSIQDESMDAYALMGASHACVVIGASTTGLEVVAFRKPLIEAPLPGQQHISFTQEGVADQVGGFEQFGEAIEKALRDGITGAREYAIDKYLAKHFAYQDTGTVGRIVDMVESMLFTKQPIYQSINSNIVQEDWGEYWLLYRPGTTCFSTWIERAKKIGNAMNYAIIGGLQINNVGLVHHMGIAFNGNQSPISLYKMLGSDQYVFQYERHFKAIEFPFFIHKSFMQEWDINFIGGFDAIDLCLRVGQQGGKIVYIPEVSCHSDWERLNEDQAYKFYAKWTGHLWQNDMQHLAEDGLTHDSLAQLYLEQALQVAKGT